MIRSLLLISCLVLLNAPAASAIGEVEHSADVMSLAGEWRFAMGSPAEGMKQGNLPPVQFNDTIQLPGTTDTNKKGTPNFDQSTESLSQPYRFEGVCWYEKDVTIPQGWRNRVLTLELERTKYSQVWLDGKPLGENRYVCTPQDYLLATHALPGVHKLTVAVDNRRLPPFGADSHQYSGNTQGNWNGIIGDISLSVVNPVSIADFQLYPDAMNRKLRAKVKISNLGPAVTGSISLTTGGAGSELPMKLTCPPGDSVREMELSLGPNAPLWNEFHPSLLDAKVRLRVDQTVSEKHASFGLIDFKTRDHQFTANGQTIFLRGKHDGCVFPLTGYPPMEQEGWLRYFKICKQYGLNHVRFHTWCPPEAAFEAADRLGIYLQPELPYWGNFDQTAYEALKPQAIQILRRYGNHPSFVMFSMGNEHWGTIDVLNKLVGELKAEDPRRLYVRGTNAISWIGHPGVNDDYLITADVHDASGKSIKMRGANAGPENLGHIQTGPANTLTEYSEGAATTQLPVVTHEMGQYTIFPNFAEIAKYTGVDKPYNLERFAQKLSDSGMASQDLAFAKASGALAALCYREEIESCLRTPKDGGFELLDLQDYPGQGTALVGILDAFMDSKGAISPEDWRQFCGPTVLLAKFAKYTWTRGERFAAGVEVAHYGEQDLSQGPLDWNLAESDGRIVQTGSVPIGTIKTGGLRQLGQIDFPISGVGRFTLNLSLHGTKIQTKYPLWFYESVPHPAPDNLQIVSSLTGENLKQLNSGAAVLLLCADRDLASSVGGGFASDFWDFPMFHNKPGTMGILCDPTAPALREFATESHSNWQWFNILTASQPLILDSLFPSGTTPIVQVIDNYDRCHKLGLIFEAKVGKGRLLVCAADLIALGKDHPEAAQLLRSLTDYAASPQFQPINEVNDGQLVDLLRVSLPPKGWTATASSFDDNWKGYKPQQLVDGNVDKIWRADPKVTGPSWCRIDFPYPLNLSGAEIIWGDGKLGYKYRMEYSTDGKTWITASDQTDNVLKQARHNLPFFAQDVKSVRIQILATPGGETASIGEVRFFAANR